jgi:diguanylate cyclase (GGDEF)-like protein/PAS domain S-box-containing protein
MRFMLSARSEGSSGGGASPPGVAYRFGALARHSSDMISLLDRSGVIRAQTGATREILGRDWEELQDVALEQLAHPDDRPSLCALWRRGVSGDRVEWRVRHADGSWIHVESSARDLSDDPQVGGIALMTRDVSRRRALEDQLRHSASHDTLTELPNRALFYDRVEHALRASAATGTRVAVLFIDLDDFKDVNDELGHAAGDELLLAVAGRLRSCLRTGDVVARLGGDEFGAVLSGVTSVGEPVQVAERILAAVGHPYELRGTVVRTAASVGISISGERDDAVAEDLLHSADVAMYAAKRQGKGQFVLGTASAPPDDAPQLATWFQGLEEQREEILSRLRLPEPVTPVFQPILDLRTGTVAGYEALARFPGAVFRPPNAWFAEAHRCGLGSRLEAVAARAALAGGPPPDGGFVAVNLSPSALQSPEVLYVLPDDLTGVVIEITENELVSREQLISRTLADLRARGARIALDDAGAGYAGFKQLMRLRPDIIKLDRELVTGVDADPIKAALIDAFQRFARRLGALVCAEGVETEAELEALIRLDVDFAQGWAIARPGNVWPGPSPEAVARCAATRRELLRGALAEAGTPEEELARITRQVLGARSVTEIEAALELVGQLLSADEVYLSGVDGGDVVTLTHSGGSRSVGERFSISELPATRWVLETGEAVQILVSDPQADPAEVAILREDGQRSMLMLPVTAGDCWDGLLEVTSAAERPWSRLEIHHARLIADQLGAALAGLDARAAA